MIHERCISIESREAWQAALAGLPHSFCHTWDYAHAVSLRSGRRPFLFCWEDGLARGVCPLVEREYHGSLDLVTPNGVSSFTGVGIGPSAMDILQAFAARKGYVCGYIGLHPLFADWAPSLDRAVREKTLYILDLRLTEAELFARLSTDRRRRLRNWNARASSELILDRGSLTEFFVSQHSAFMKRKAAADIYRLSAASLEHLCALENILLVGAGSRGQIEAASMCGFTPFLADGLFTASLPTRQRHSAALVWWHILELKRLGIPYLNLGGGIREGDRISDFKRRFGGLELPLMAVQQVYDGVTYERLCREAGQDPCDRRGYFPPYHRQR